MLVRILAARRRQMGNDEEFSTKQKLSLGLVATLVILYFYFMISVFFMKSVKFWSDLSYYRGFMAWNYSVIFKSINFAFAMGLLYLFVSMTLQKVRYEPGLRETIFGS